MGGREGGGLVEASIPPERSHISRSNVLLVRISPAGAAVQSVFASDAALVLHFLKDD